MKKVLLLTLISIISITLVTGCTLGKKPTEEPKTVVKANTKENIIKDQTLGVFKFTRTSLLYKDGTSYLETSVTNTSDSAQTLQEFKIHVKDSKDNEIVTLTGFVGDKIDAGDTKVITSSYGADLSKAESIEYELIK